MWRYLMNLWAMPPVSLSLNCPIAPGGQVTSTIGTFDDSSVRAAFDLASMESAAIVVIAVACCYLLTRVTMGPAFKRRWLLWLAVASVACFAVVWLELSHAPTHALANSCQSDPSPFPMPLPTSVVVGRAIAGLVWGGLAFVVVAWLGTFTLGRWPGLQNGFFHNRGWPWPAKLTAR